MLSKEESNRLKHYELQVAKRRANYKGAKPKGGSVYRSGIVYRVTPIYPSVTSTKGVAARKDNLMYTGGRLIGIGTLHKSNLVPIFSQEEAKDVSTMRRN